MCRSLLVVGLLVLSACERTPALHVEKSEVRTGEDVVVVLDERLAGPAVDQYWVTLRPADAPPDDTMGRIVLERSDRTLHFHTSAPGEFEVRLYDRYPQDEHHLLARVPVRVDGWIVDTGQQMIRR